MSALPALQSHQLPPDGAWAGWLLLAGRGAGKTYAGARWLLAQAERTAHLRIIAPTYADARDVCAEGPSGLVPMAREAGLLETWNRSLGEIRLSNGCRAKLFSADEPDRLRGPQAGADWYDELAAWRYAEATLDMALMGLRLTERPRYVVTTTPRPVPAVRRLLADPNVVTTRASTYANMMLPDAFKDVIMARYAGTRLGRQELEAELLEDNPDALWQRSDIEKHRRTAHPPLSRIVVAIDPSATTTGDEAGIVVAAIGEDGRGYVLDDRSLQGSPATWAKAAIAAYGTHRADRMVAEVNNGGEMVELTIRSSGGQHISYKALHASRGKITRAEPVAALYEQGRVSHVGTFAALEDELCAWQPGMPSPNRLDALVWALTELMLGGAEIRVRHL